MERVIRIVLIGYGKIAADQHVPAIAGNENLELVAVVSRRGAGPAGIPVFATIADLVSNGLKVDAAVLCTSPGDRPAAAFAAIAAGWHLLLEKPAASSLSAVAAIEQQAAAAGLSVFAAWHSRFAPAVARARALLADRTVTGLSIEWREDVRKWHPDQEWIWQAGGFGVFDAGINGLSVATEILPCELSLASAVLSIPCGRQTPVAAELRFDGPNAQAQASAIFDWRETKGECWTVRVDAGTDVILLTSGGAELSLNGKTISAEGPGEYPALYERFVDLLADGKSEVDVRPLRLTADAFLQGERRTVDPMTD